MPTQHWMTFATFSEQEFFTYPDSETYHGIVLNANMVAHAPAGIAAFLLEKVSPGACFLVDPMTHAFQHNPETISNGDKGPKSSIRTLAVEYGEFISRILGERPIRAAEVLQNAEEFSRNVISFQWNFLEAHFRNNENAKYLEDAEVIKRPSILVSPYFYLTEDNLGDWIPVMQATATASRACIQGFEPAPKLYSAIVVNRSILQVDNLREQVVASFSAMPLDGVLIWIDEFDENNASALELKGFGLLCGQLRNAGFDVLNLHGGYFSCLLSSEALGRRLTGVSHGPEFGESRSVVPVGGGIPISRFYVPDLHLRAKFRDFLPTALRKQWLASSAAFHAEVCNCAECRAIINGNADNFQLYGESEVKSIKRKNGVVRIEFPTTEAKKRCLRHYLCRKKAEFEAISNGTRASLVADLDTSYNKFLGAESVEVISHLQRWKRVIQELEGL